MSSADAAAVAAAAAAHATSNACHSVIARLPCRGRVASIASTGRGTDRQEQKQEALRQQQQQQHQCLHKKNIHIFWTHQQTVYTSAEKTSKLQKFCTMELAK